jgi:hypothetical protein
MTLMIRWFPAGLWIFRIEVYVLGYGVVCAHRVSNSTVQMSGFVYIPEYAETLCGSLQAHPSILEHKGWGRQNLPNAAQRERRE